MKQLSIAVLFVMEVAVLALGLNGMLGGWWVFPKDPILSLISPSKDSAAIVATHRGAPAVVPEAVHPQARAYWTAFFLLPLLHWATILSVRVKRRSIPIKTTSSESISIYESAIVQFVGSALGEIPAIVGHRVRVRQLRDGLSMRIFVKLRPVEHIPTVQSQIEDVVRRRVAELLGIQKIHEITVDVEGFGKFRRRAEEPNTEIAIQVRPESEASAPPPAAPRIDEVILKEDGPHSDWSSDAEPSPLHPEESEPQEITLHPHGAHSETAKIVPASDEAEGEGDADPYSRP